MQKRDENIKKILLQNAQLFRFRDFCDSSASIEGEGNGYTTALNLLVVF